MDSMNKGQKQEQAYLEQVEAYLAESLGRLYEKREELKQELLAARKNMWDEGRHLIRNFDETIQFEDVLQLAGQNQDISTAERGFQRNELEIARQAKLRFSPYFGRLDYQYQGRGHTIYIGIYSLRQEEARKLLVVDWRAPAASMFYSFDVGPGWFEPPSGRRDVDITLKRQLKIEDSRLLMMYNSDSAMYDEILGSVLAQNTEHTLRIIIGSIQKEQNAAIRCATNQSCLIYGLAGSGKNSVGLHRLAYILYHNRARIQAEQVLILSNNGIFQSYISAILPDLGEKPAESTVFHHLLQELVGEEYEVEDYYEYLHQAESQPASPRWAWMGVKYSPAFLDGCAACFSNFAYTIPELRYREALVLSQEIFEKRWRRTGFSSFRASYELAEQIVREAVEDFFRENEARIKQDIDGESQVFLSDKEAAFLYRRRRQQYITSALEEIARLNQLEPKAQAVKLLGDWLERSGQDCQGSLELFRELQTPKLRYEDALYYLYIRCLMGAVPARPAIRHILIDEAQDYNPLQLRIIRLLHPKSKYTILADGFQALNPLTTVGSQELFQWAFGAELLKIRLDTCYRSSSEINRLAFQLIKEEYPQLDQEYSYFERCTQKPRYVICKEPLPALRLLLRQMIGCDSVAIITSDWEQARQVKGYLGQEAKLMASPESRLESGVVILPLVLAKGLEFDGAILLHMAGTPRADLRRRLYLGCTRALHQLCLLEAQELPSPLADCAPYVETIRLENMEPESWDSALN